MSALEVALSSVLVLLGAGLALAFFRVARGPSAPDRIVALDLVAGIAVGMIAVYCALTEEPQLLRVAMGLALLSFLGTATVARYLERQAARRRACAAREGQR